ncbi:hypothetical protein G3I01_15350 [Gramella sp. MT6]|uniref:hypothetical protein n=1 Tax=Gramella sp. MT6 TaxID=2705471 RepID=UPI001C5EA5DB|nr:hypothetical protein [Gramella sp. MT6]QYA26811.1 hypothetical protein G3I01_15350 [Gramella sp. MT6]
MKTKRFISAFALCASLIMSSQVNAQSENNVEIGDVLKIGKADNYQYTHVDFPKPNFIIKKGGIANYDQLSGTLVEVTKIRNNDKGQTTIILKRRDGKKFFGSFSEIKADYQKAIASAELVEN